MFDATSAGAHKHHDAVLQSHGKRVIDLTPAAIGPFVIPSVNGDAQLDAPNVNMVTCGGQATIPIVHAVNRLAAVHYGEIVASIASKSAGPGTRANIERQTLRATAAQRVRGGLDDGRGIGAMAVGNERQRDRCGAHGAGHLTGEFDASDHRAGRESLPLSVNRPNTGKSRNSERTDLAQ